MVCGSESVGHAVGSAVRYAELVVTVERILLEAVRFAEDRHNGIVPTSREL
jgi:hypothetical protein